MFTRATLLCLGAIACACSAHAHGIESLGTQSHKAEKPQAAASFWDFLTNPAQAAKVGKGKAICARPADDRRRPPPR